MTVKNKAQNILGFALLMLVVIAALVGMSKYFKNALGGQIRQAADSVGGGDQYDPGSSEQYPFYGGDSATTGASN